MNDFNDHFASGSVVTDVPDLPAESTSILAQACAGLRAENERLRAEAEVLRVTNRRLVHDVERNGQKVWPGVISCLCKRSMIAYDPLPDEPELARSVLAAGWRIVGGEHVCGRCK